MAISWAMDVTLGNLSLKRKSDMTDISASSKLVLGRIASLPTKLKRLIITKPNLIGILFSE